MRAHPINIGETVVEKVRVGVIISEPFKSKLASPRRFA